MDVPSRALTGLERFWLAAERIQPGFLIHLFVDAEGALPEGFTRALRRAVEAAAAVHPGFRSRVRGWGRGTRHVADAPAPQVLEQIGGRWVGADGAGAAWMAEPLDLGRGPGVEVRVLRGQVERVVFRAHHAVADGRAILAFATTVFGALRGEAPPTPAALLHDLDIIEARAGFPLRRDDPRLRWRPEPRRYPPLLGSPSETTMDTRWARVTTANPGRDVTPRLLAAVVATADAAGLGDAVLVSLPVDLREPGQRADGNLTALTTLPRARLGDDAARRAALAKVRDLEVLAPASCFADRMRGVPIWLLAWAGRRGARLSLAEGRFDASVTLTNLGRMDPAALSGGGFVARHAWWVPPGSPGNPLLLLVSGFRDRLDLCASAPVGLASGGRLEAWLAAIGERVSRG
jgi:hypothetical protein